MNPMKSAGIAFQHKLTQPQLWLLALACRHASILTEDIRKARGSENFSRAVISYSLKALAKRGLVRLTSTERQMTRCAITVRGAKLADELKLHS